MKPNTFDNDIGKNMTASVVIQYYISLRSASNDLPRYVFSLTTYIGKVMAGVLNVTYESDLAWCRCQHAIYVYSNDMYLYIS